MRTRSQGPTAPADEVITGVDGQNGPRFLKGVAISVWQNTGDPDSNWTRYAHSRWPFRSFGIPAIRGKYNIDVNTDFWNRYIGRLGLGVDYD
jgi:hypothetical protein